MNDQLQIAESIIETGANSAENVRVAAAIFQSWDAIQQRLMDKLRQALENEFSVSENKSVNRPAADEDWWYLSADRKFWYPGFSIAIETRDFGVINLRFEFAGVLYKDFIWGTRAFAKESDGKWDQKNDTKKSEKLRMQLNKNGLFKGQDDCFSAFQIAKIGTIGFDFPTNWIVGEKIWEEIAADEGITIAQRIIAIAESWQQALNEINA